MTFFSVNKLYIFLLQSDYVKIIDGEGTEVFNQDGCWRFNTETLLDVQFGSYGNISIQMALGTSLGSTRSSVRIQFAVLKKGIFSGTF